MPYCLAADVAKEFKDIDFSTTGAAVVTADVNGFIDEADAEINSLIGLVYLVPVTVNASTMLLLKSISIMIVSQRVRDIVAVKTGNSDVDQDARTNSRKEALKMLDRIVKLQMALPGATKIDSKDGVSSYAVDVGLEHTFKKGTDQW